MTDYREYQRIWSRLIRNYLIKKEFSKVVSKLFKLSKFKIFYYKKGF